MRVTILYNRAKRVFIAKRGDGKVIAESGNFAEVEALAHRETSNIHYHYSSFPKHIKEKLLGRVTECKNGDDFKSLFMKLVFSYTGDAPPDGLTRKITRKMLKMGLRFCKTIRVGSTTYIITRKQSDFFVFEVRNIKGHGWEYDLHRKLKFLPDEVIKAIEGLREVSE